MIRTLTYKIFTLFLYIITHVEACRLTAVETPFGTTQYEYDLMDRLVRVVAHDGTATLYEYDVNGNRTSVKYANGIVVTYEYDKLNRLIREKAIDKNGSPVVEYTYTLGAAGERLKVEETDRTVEYEYDAAYRLTKETATNANGTTVTEYTYDKNSNRLTKTVDGTITGYSYNELNQLVSETGISYEYDLNGNLVKKTEGEQTTTYTYNAQNKLIRVTVQSGQQVNEEAIEEGDVLSSSLICIQLITDTYALGDSCFTGDTLVAAENGQKRIDEIEIGDKVWAYDVETGETELKAVTKVYVHSVDEILHLYTDEGIIDTTTNHPFYVIGEGWVAAGDLEVGDEVYNLDSTTSVVIGYEVEKLDEPVLVYNLEVEDLHSYFVGCVPVLVHNYVVKEKGVIIDSYYPNDHGNPVHLHVKGEGPATKIGSNGYPVKGSPELSPKQAKVVENNLKLIKHTIRIIQKWIKNT